MTLRFKYFLFISVLHLALATLSYLLLEKQRVFFIGVEVLVIISLIISFRIYRSFIRPIKLMQQGTDAILDKDFNITFTKTGSLEMDHLIGVYNAMIHKIREERVTLKEQHYFLEKLINASPGGIIILNFNKEVDSMNPAALKMLEANDSMIGLNINESGHPLLQAILHIPSGESKIITIDGWRKYKCHVSDFIHQGFNRSFLLIEELSNEILVTEKRAYGKVIRMMAHEVNNSIGAVNSILHSLRDIEQEDTEEESEEIMEVLDTAIGRNDRLNLFMKNFADVIRLPQARMELLDVNHLVRKTADFMSLLAEKKNIKLHYDFCEADIKVQLDQAQIEQVLINIIKNASESIDNGGKITFITSNSPKQLIIEDDGNGISKEHEEHLFKPFYSTKPDGQGIGLTLIKEILHQHDITFSLKTIKEGKTQFKMIFPN